MIMEDPQIQLALEHHKAGRFAEAQWIYRRILTHNPQNATALNYHGVLAVQTGQLEMAVKLLQQAASINSTDAGIRCNLGEAQRQLGRTQAAIASFQAAIGLNPRLAVAHNNLGITFSAAGDLESAADSYRRAVQLDPGYAEAHGNLGNALKELRHFEEAVAECRVAVSLRPGNAECHNQLGAALAESGELDEAVVAYKIAIRIYPHHAEAHTNLGNALAAQGRVRDAIASCETAVGLKPESVPAHWNYAVALLRAGDYENGWREHEWRLRGLAAESASRFSIPAWNGAALEGRTILVHAEQGFGDAIQFARFVPLVAARGGRVILECQAELVALMAGIAGVEQVIAQGKPLPKFDEHVPLMSLPLVLHVRMDDLPGTLPYLQTDPAISARWRERVREVADRANALHVGVCWLGNPVHRNDRDRSIPLEFLAPLAHSGAVLHSLHNRPIHDQPKSI
jgi:Tfp pilus assembly protein PilF